jgi:hypothetical protein
MHRVAVLVLCLAACSRSPDQHRDPRRITLLATGVDTADFIVSDIVRTQRNLFDALASGGPIRDMTYRMFTIRDLNRTPTRQDSSIAAILKLAAMPAPFDTSAITNAGDLTAFSSFEVLKIESHQIVVISQKADKSVRVWTDWMLEGNRWVATQMYFNPTDEMIDRFRGYARSGRL